MNWILCVGLILTSSQGSVAASSDVIAASGIDGGVVVHVGFADGRDTVKMYRGSRFCVQGLDEDPVSVERARHLVDQTHQGANVSFDTFDGQHLPYVDNMVNLLVVSQPGKVPPAEMMRVLAPRGVLMIRDGDTWRRSTKPVPPAIDEWTHYLHGPDNNAVAQDTVLGPPRHLQWQGGPKWTRHHDCMSSLSALVSSNGRLFYIIDEGSTASIFLPSHWALIARDAFNGKILWKRPIKTWYSRFKALKSGPADAPRRLVAIADRVYLTLNLDGPVVCLDARTGATLREYSETRHAEELLVSGDTLLVLCGPGSLVDGMRPERPVEQRTIKAFDVTSGKPLWQTTDVIAATTLATDMTGVYYFDFQQRQAVCVERSSGRERWRSVPLPSPKTQTSFFASKLVVSDGVVLFAGGEFSGLTKSGGGETRSDTLTALSAARGELLWQAKHPPSGYSSPENLFVIDGVVWADASSNGRLDGTVVGLDLKTGVERHRFATDKTSYWFHHRCYPGRASSKYIMTSRTGIEFIDLQSQHWDLNHWVRGACVYGIMPCNGLVYAPPSPCICYAESYLHSFNAFAPKRSSNSEPLTRRPQLSKGPAYGLPVDGQARDDDWPTYRGNNKRDGYTETAVPSALQPVWSTSLGTKLSSIVVADSRLFVAAVDQRKVVALDAETGRQLWQFICGGRVDSPPTWHQGRVLFGSADGHVYCLRADDGQLIWQLRARPADRQLLVYEQLESLWPIHGSVLVRDGSAYFVAGRSAFVDGGMVLCRVDVATGELVDETPIGDRVPETGQNLQTLVKWLNMPVARPDILSCDDQRMYMRSQAFEFTGKRLRLGPTAKNDREGSLQDPQFAHVFCPTGFTDDSWFHRSYWLYGSTWGSGWSGYYIAGKYAPAGKILTANDDAVFVFGRQPQYYKWTLPLEYRLFAANKDWQPSETPEQAAQRRRTGKSNRKQDPGPGGNSANYRWITEVPLLVRAMVLADKTLFLAGPQDRLDERSLGRLKHGNAADVAAQEAALRGRKGAMLVAVSATTGKQVAKYDLGAPPVFDGMAVAHRQLYVATTDGKIQCWSPASGGKKD